MAGKKLSIALIQMASVKNKGTNIKRACQLVSTASKNGAELIVLPEYFTTPPGIERFREHAEMVPGEISKTLAALAKENKIYLIGGTFPEKHEDRIYNTCLTYGPDGELLAKYRKVHIFDVDIRGKISFLESDAISAGNELVTFKTPQLKVGLLVCYDIRFPMMATRYSKMGCNFIVLLGAFGMTTGPVHWELLARARAVDNQLYVAMVSTSRDETSSYVVWGHTSLVNPWGDVIAKADDKEKIVYSTIDLELLNEVRRQMPIREQERNELREIGNCKNL